MAQNYDHTAARPDILFPVLVTGSAGFIGTNLMLELRRLAPVDGVDGAQLIGVDRRPHGLGVQLSRGEAVPGDRAPVATVAQAALYTGDMLQDDGAWFSDIVRRHKPRTVLHLAALAGVRASLRNSELFHKVNVRGTEIVLQAAGEHGACHAVVASSSSVYGHGAVAPDGSGGDNAESQRLQPLSPYAVTKTKTEDMCSAAAAKWAGLTVAAVRPHNVYGPWGRPDTLIPRLLRAVSCKDGKMSLFGDGELTRDFTYVLDLVRGIIAAASPSRTSVLDSTVAHVFNLGTGVNTSLNSLVCKLAAALGRGRATLPIDTIPKFDIEHEPLHTRADTRKSAEVLGWKAAMDIDSGVRSTVDWFLSSTTRAVVVVTDTTPEQLRTTLGSLQAQTRKCDAVVVVCDTTAASALAARTEVVRQAAATKGAPHIVQLLNQGPAGSVSARNTALAWLLHKVCGQDAPTHASGGSVSSGAGGAGGAGAGATTPRGATLAEGVTGPPLGDASPNSPVGTVPEARLYVSVLAAGATCPPEYVQRCLATALSARADVVTDSAITTKTTAGVAGAPKALFTRLATLRRAGLYDEQLVEPEASQDMLGRCVALSPAWCKVAVLPGAAVVATTATPTSTAAPTFAAAAMAAAKVADAAGAPVGALGHMHDVSPASDRDLLVAGGTRRAGSPTSTGSSVASTASLQPGPLEEPLPVA